MSVASAMGFTRRPWNTTPAAAGQPTGLPGGYWVASFDNEGDSTGGTISFQHIFSNPVGIGRRDNNFYSLEEVMLTDQNATAHEYHLEVIGMDSDALGESNIRPVEQHSTINAQSHGTVGSAFAHAMNIWRARQSRIWIGRFHGLDTEFGAILVETDNFDGDRFIGKLQGVWWPPGAENAPLGIIRPTDTIYGS